MKNLFMIIATAAVLACPTISFAQDCTVYFPMQEGTSFTLTNYDKKGKETSVVMHEVIENNSTASGMELVVSSITTDKKGRESLAVDYTVKCDKGEFFIDMRNFVPASSQQSFSSMGLDATVEGDYLVFPPSMSVGQRLPGGTLTISASIMNMTIRISDRKVEAEESITTPAGTYECVKISYLANVKMGINIASRITEWYSKDVGIVRSETYNKNGKMYGYSELTSFSK
ncbi:MAG: hypothetical protein AAF655_14210 [Bacteroidota bacterium]